MLGLAEMVNADHDELLVSDYLVRETIQAPGGERTGGWNGIMPLASKTED